MAAPIGSRAITDLASLKAGSALHAGSTLCLPMGSTEQHGPHLPFDTDTVIAEAMVSRIVERWGETYDLWQLPALDVGLSHEHAWAAGTVSLSVGDMTLRLRELARDIVESQPARNLLIVNGHGGNRGILEAISRELAADFRLNLCALHLGALISPVTDAPVPEIHAGKDETSVMLVLAPDRVRQDKMRELKAPPADNLIRTLILDPVTSWPWSSNDKRLAEAGVIGDARDASAEHGKTIIARVVEAAGAVLKQLRDNQA
jgi:creatinine amidohydrolase/Fe(II)-dependent formamide hydrolase-like protein